MGCRNRNEPKMASYSFSASSSHSSSSSSSSSSVTTGAILDQLNQVLLTALRTDKPRLWREFYYPERISLTGHYYPRNRVTGASQTGSTHISYLARPYFSYKVPSKYGFSKFVTIRKL